MKELQEFIDKKLIHPVKGFSDVILTQKVNNSRIWFIHPIGKVYCEVFFYSSIEVKKVLECLNFTGDGKYIPKKGDFLRQLRTKTKLSDWNIYQTVNIKTDGLFMKRRMEELGFSEIIYATSNCIGRQRGTKNNEKRIIKLEYPNIDFSLIIKRGDVYSNMDAIEYTTIFLRNKIEKQGLENKGVVNKLKELSRYIRKNGEVELKMQVLDDEYLVSNNLDTYRKTVSYNYKQIQSFLGEDRLATKPNMNAWVPGGLKDIQTKNMKPSPFSRVSYTY